MTAPGSIDGTALLRWIELALPDAPWSEAEPFVGFVYLDAQVGMSAKGGRAGDPDQVEQPGLTVRLPIGVPSKVLTADEARARGLPDRPGWVTLYGPQPAPDGPWRTDPALRGRFHKSFPDDLQVLVHDGEPRRTGKPAEVCWLRVIASEDGERRVYLGELLSTPRQLTTVHQGDHLRFLPAPGGRHPLYVTDAYLAERGSWRIAPCTSCGLAETLDPPSVMAQTRFAGTAAADAPVMFSAHCAACSGTQVVERVAR